MRVALRQAVATPYGARSSAVHLLSAPATTPRGSPGSVRPPRLVVRCKVVISHNPAEYGSPGDMGVAMRR